ncbi:MAG: PEP-CTERM sorting domain-containing protein [Bryobacteraceae bacterium]|jgi:hypothetical protein
MRNTFCVLITLIAASCAARADTFFTSSGAWDSSVSGITTINFASLAPSDSYANVTPSDLVGGVTFEIGPSAPGGADLFVLGGSSPYSSLGVNTMSEESASGTLDLEISLPSSVTALAFHDFDYPGTYAITLSDGATPTQVITGPSGTPQELFFGVTDPGGLTSVNITIPYSQVDESINLVDFSYATANPTSAVPEPSTFLLSGVMLLGIFGIRRRAICR